MGGVPAVTSGLNSTNTLDGIIPSATITVYLTGTQTLATLYANSSGTPLSNPFTSNAINSVNPGGWIFWAATNQGYDIVASGGISPNTYSQPVTLCADCYPGFSFSPTGTITLQHNGSATGISQTVYNNTDNSTLTPDTGYTLAKFLTNTGGAWAVEYQTPAFQSLTTTGTTGPATLSGGILNVPNYSAGSSGVTSLNSLTGALSITGDSSITVTPSGSSIALHATGSGGTGVQYNAANTLYVFASDSLGVIDSDSNTVVAATAASCDGTNCTITVPTATFHVGQYIRFNPQVGGWSPSCLSWSVAPILSTGFTATQFEVSEAATILPTYAGCTGTVSGTGGNISSDTNTYPSQTAALPYFTQGGTISTNYLNYSIPGDTITAANTNYTARYHAASPAVTGKPAWIIIEEGSNDLGAKETAATIETAFQNFETSAHTDGYKIALLTMPGGASAYSCGTGCSSYAVFNAVQDWIRANQCLPGTTSTQCADYVVDVSSVTNVSDGTFWQQSGNFVGHPTNAGASVFAARVEDAFTFKNAANSQGTPNLGSNTYTAQQNVILPYTGNPEPIAAWGNNQGSNSFAIAMDGYTNLINDYYTTDLNGFASNANLDAKFLYGSIAVQAYTDAQAVFGFGGATNNSCDACLSYDTALNNGTIDVGFDGTQNIFIGNTSGGMKMKNLYLTSASGSSTVCPNGTNSSLTQLCGHGPSYVMQSAAVCTGLSTAFPSSVTAGNLILVAFDNADNSTNTISDTLGTSYTLLKSLTGNSENIWIYGGRAPSTGSDTVTVSASASSDECLSITEATGVTPAVNVSASNYIASGTNTTTISPTIPTSDVFAAIGSIHNSNVLFSGNGLAIASQAAAGNPAIATGFNVNAGRAMISSVGFTPNQTTDSAMVAVALVPNDSTGSNCSSTASPAACGSALAGTVQVAAAATTLTVDTTVVSPGSEIFYSYTTAASGCGTAPANMSSLLPAYTSAIVAGTSFTLTLPVAPTTNAACVSYEVKN